MDNPAAPIPSTPPQPAVQPEVFSPVEPSNRHWLLWSAIGLTFLTLGIAVGVFSAKFLNQSQEPSPLTSTPTPAPSPQSPTLTPTPALTPDLTADWKTYTHPILGYSFSYSESVSVEVYDNSTLVRIDPPDPRMIVGICPRWISFSAVDSSSSTKKTQDDYKCVNDTFILEEKIFVESQYREGSQKIIDQILSTFHFLK